MLRRRGVDATAGIPRPGVDSGGSEPVGASAASSYEQHQLGKLQILWLGALLSAVLPGIRKGAEGSSRKILRPKRVFRLDKPTVAFLHALTVGQGGPRGPGHRATGGGALGVIQQLKREKR